MIAVSPKRSDCRLAYLLKVMLPQWFRQHHLRAEREQIR
jgi:hypothetical protein